MTVIPSSALPATCAAVIIFAANLSSWAAEPEPRRQLENGLLGYCGLQAGDNPALAAKAATPAMPIVFAVAGDPVQLGVVANLNRPGGNVTGVSFFSSKITSKRLGLLHELVPTLTSISLLANPRNAGAEAINQISYPRCGLRNTMMRAE